MIKIYNHEYNYYKNYHPISKDIMKNILYIINIKSSNIDINNIINKLNPNAQKLIQLYSDYDFIHKKMLITFKEFIHAIFSNIYNDDDLIEKINKLYENNPVCKCTSCLIIDIISIL